MQIEFEFRIFARRSSDIPFFRAIFDCFVSHCRSFLVMTSLNHTSIPPHLYTTFTQMYIISRFLAPLGMTSLYYMSISPHLHTTTTQMCKCIAPNRITIPATRPTECQIEIIRMLNYIGLTGEVKGFLPWLRCKNKMRFGCPVKKQPRRLRYCLTFHGTGITWDERRT